MSQESELKIDDGTEMTSIRVQCATCEESLEVDASRAETTESEGWELRKYPFACPACRRTVVLNLRYVRSA